ncbi:MAG: gliding motility-associated C-terminal domain-containing protein [Sphingobacteriales bacterium]|nr:gliding motility-associated C-terminal domain-containing protein [Sphingobacteriales bacterium]
MKSKLFVLIPLFTFFITPSYARHLKGGFFSYQYLGPGSQPNTASYKIILTEYMDCNAVAGQQVDNSLKFSFFNAANYNFLQTIEVNLSSLTLLSKTQDEQCISGDQSGCYYKIAFYELSSVELPITPNGYIVSHQRCCRIDNIVNIVNSASIGNTYSIAIPGTNAGFNADKNSSALFLINDTSVVCGGSPFKISFDATDPDGDSLSYYFCNALEGGGPTQGQVSPDPAANPPYFSTPYQSPFSGTSPMGSAVTINPKTGIISGIAPGVPGEYVVSVCVNEYRKGIVIATNRKELHVVVGNCSPLKSKPPIDYTTCDGFTINFSNSSTGNIQNYFWDFGDKTTTTDTSLLVTPTYTYADTGRYKVTLIVNRGLLCTDTGYTTIGIYPGFFPNFTYQTTCKGAPTLFADATTTKYGVVDSWRWDFGNTAATNDTSHLKNPAYTYITPGNYDVQLIVSNSKGCIDTVQQTVPVLDKPPLSITNDTLICDIDTLQLNAVGTGIFTWSPNYNINNINAQNPLVSPDVPTKYYVNLNAGPGCVNSDSVLVDVKKFVTLKPPADTTICKGDAIVLNPSSDALSYKWTPTNTLDDPNKKNPVASPLSNTRYTVIGNIGKCQATASVNVKVVPYPTVTTSGDKRICFDDTTQLNAQIIASRFTWSPQSNILNGNTLNPLVFPNTTTDYIITVRDTLGCPKPVSDTVTVTVIPPIQAFGGNDTNIVINQPLQLIATGGTIYNWQPATGLNNTNIYNPVAILQNSQQYIVKVSTPEGCFAFDTINVRVFITPPSFFVPNAFTPNTDGRNDTFKPIAAGISVFKYFRIYNRWGQLVFSTNRLKDGWDGTLKGREQPLGVYVWVAEGITFTGITIKEKGTVALIR